MLMEMGDEIRALKTERDTAIAMLKSLWDLKIGNPADAKHGLSDIGGYLLAVDGEGG
tara:strand:- start:1824 stop:1994 length:171 start_codon:yes stop_codon:yes gene_type:complete